MKYPISVVRNSFCLVKNSLEYRGNGKLTEKIVDSHQGEL